MSKFFSMKLYREGIKKSKLVGLTGAIIITALCALVPLVGILTPRYYEPNYVPPTEIIGPGMFAIPLLILLLFAPLLVSTMFSYLNKRNESDFYHSIPFTRPCVYFSFLAAAFTWVLIALTASLVATSLLWLGVPYTAYSILTPLALFATYFLATLLLTAFMAVAMTLTGTSVSNGLIFALLFGFVRLSGAFFIMALENEYPILVTALTPARLLSPDYSMPLALLNSMNDGGKIFSNFGVWIYTAILAIALIAAGCYFYLRRRSEMAGQSAPNRILQHVYRCAITLPMAFLTAYILILDGFEFAVLLIMVVLTLIVYYLFEIITTKKLKNCISATPYLLVVLAGGILFGVSIPVSGSVALNYTPEADEIKSISMYNDQDDHRYGDAAYEDLLISKVEISSPEAKKMIADELKEMKETVSKSNASQYLHPDRYNYTYDEMIGGSYDYDKVEIDYKQVTLKITDKSGIVRGRTLCFTEDEYRQLQEIFSETKEYEEALLAMPSKDEILNIYFSYSYNSSEATCRELWDCFIAEYNKLPREEKIAYKSENGYYSDLMFEIRGSVGMDSFYRNYSIDPKRFPETAKRMVEEMNTCEESVYNTMLISMERDDSQYVYLYFNSGFDSLYYDEQCIAKTGLKALKFLDGCKAPADDSAIFVRLDISLGDGYYTNRFYLVSEADYLTFCQMVGAVNDLEKPIE